MKIRTDFVTNSSSSSFIIATHEQIPERYSHVVRPVTKENALEVIKETSDYEWTEVAFGISDEEFQKLGGFTDEQMVLMRLNACDQIDRYQHLLKSLQAADRPVYHVFVDRDVLYDDAELSHLVTDSVVIEERTDL